MYIAELVMDVFCKHRVYSADLVTIQALPIIDDLGMRAFRAVRSHPLLHRLPQPQHAVASLTEWDGEGMGMRFIDPLGDS